MWGGGKEGSVDVQEPREVCWLTSKLLEGDLIQQSTEGEKNNEINRGGHKVHKTELGSLSYL